MAHYLINQPRKARAPLHALLGTSGIRQGATAKTSITDQTKMPGAVKFVVPTVADGYVFVGGGVPNYFNVTSCPSNTTLQCAGQLTILH